MKTIIIFLSFFAMPVFLWAQPIVSNNEFYHIGDINQMMTCNFTGITAGAAGVDQTWNFSSLISNGTTTMQVTQDTTSGFSTSNLLITFPQGIKKHVQESNSDSYLIGITDSVSGNITYYNNLTTAMRPFTYLSSFTDKYSVSIPSSASFGVGVLTVTGDAYGTLILPVGTYDNVLRIRKYQYETDTVTSPTFYITNSSTISYLWFDGIHPAPLFEIDSVNTITGTSQSAQYLTVPAGIVNLDNYPNNFSAHLDNNGLLLKGAFDLGVTYNATMINMVGQILFREEFTASGNIQRFDAGEQLASGIYLINISPEDGYSPGIIIKVVKN